MRADEIRARRPPSTWTDPVHLTTLLNGPRSSISTRRISAWRADATGVRDRRGRSPPRSSTALSTGLDSVEREPAARAHRRTCAAPVSTTTWPLVSFSVIEGIARLFEAVARAVDVLNVENQLLIAVEVGAQVNERPPDAAV